MVPGRLVYALGDTTRIIHGVDVVATPRMGSNRCLCHLCPSLASS